MVSINSTAFDVMFIFLIIAGILSVIPNGAWISMWAHLNQEESNEK